MRTFFVFLSVGLLGFLFSVDTCAADRVYNVSDFGLKANVKKDASHVLRKVLDRIRKDYREGDKIVLQFPVGQYHFYEKNATIREYYISNHDQTNPKKVGIAIEEMRDFTLDGQGSEFIFHGRMLPISLLRSENCVLKNFSIDFENPHITQIQIIDNSPENGTTYEVAPWVDYRVSKDSVFETLGDGWMLRPSSGIAFEAKSRHIVYNTSDLHYPNKEVVQVAPRRLNIKSWKDTRLVPGTVIALRTYFRPAPGIFLSHDTDTRLLNVKVHYAEGMGLLAQLCENITLDGFSVCLKGNDDPRYFTTQADATHFSGCKGKIISRNGL